MAKDAAQAFINSTYGPQVPAPAFKPGTKLRHKGDHEQKAKVLYVFPDERAIWTYMLLVQYRNVPAYMSHEGQDGWDHEYMGVWEEDPDAKV